MKFFLTLLCFILFLASCSITYNHIAGTYALENVPQTKLILNADTTFRFIKMNANPYLYAEDHVDQRFYFTTGHFYLQNKKLFLTSFSDSLPVKLAAITLDTTTSNPYSTFRFCDIYNDSVGATYVVISDSGLSGLFGPAPDSHNEIYDFEWDMKKGDTLEFVFYGYGHWKYIAPGSINHNIDVKFTPAYRPNFFTKTLFHIKGKKLVQIINRKRYIFRRVKNN